VLLLPGRSGQRDSRGLARREGQTWRAEISILGGVWEVCRVRILQWGYLAILVSCRRRGSKRKGRVGRDGSRSSLVL
jgi:hypothetical protein